MRSSVCLLISQSLWFWSSEPPDFPCSAHHVLISGVFSLQQHLWKVDHAGCCFTWDIVKVLHSSWWNCFVFVLERVLITEGCFCYCWEALKQSQGFSASHLIPPARKLGGTRIWEGTWSGRLTTTDSRDIPYHIASCSAYKVGKSRKGRHSGWWCLSSHVTIMYDRVLLSWGCLKLPVHGEWWVNFFDLLACVTFSLPIKLSLSVRFYLFLTQRWGILKTFILFILF